MTSLRPVAPVSLAAVDTTYDLARAFLAAKRDEHNAKARAELVKAQLVAALAGAPAIVVPGLGKLSYVAEGSKTAVDGKAAAELLEAAGIAVPVTFSTSAATVRASLE